MTTEIAMAMGGDLQKAYQVTQAFQRSADRVTLNEGRPLLKFVNETQEWVFGESKTPIDGCKLMIDPFNIRHGFLAFDPSKKKKLEKAETEDGKVCDICVPFTQDISDRDMPTPRTYVVGRNDIVPEAVYYYSIPMKIVDGPHAGTEVLYSNATVGAKRFGKKLTDAIAAQQRTMYELDADGKPIGFTHDECVPVIELDFDDGYENDYGKITYNPEFDILEWRSYGEAVKAETKKPKVIKSQKETPKLEDAAVEDDYDDYDDEDEVEAKPEPAKQERRQRRRRNQETEQDEVPQTERRQRRRRSA